MHFRKEDICFVAKNTIVEDYPSTKNTKEIPQGTLVEVAAECEAGECGSVEVTSQVYGYFKIPANALIRSLRTVPKSLV